VSRSRRLRIAWALNLVLVVAQVVFGIGAHSIGLVADAGHNLTDVAAITLAMFAVHMLGRPGNDRRTFGYHRGTILAAQANAASLLVVVALIGYEAIHRLLHPQAIHAGVVIVVAIAATILNLVAAKFLDDHSHDLNMRAALLHMMSDALTSAGVATAAVVIAVTGGNDWLDPAFSLVIAFVIALRAVQLLSATTHVLLESTPTDVDPAALVAAMTAVTGVEAVHDLHTWSLSSEYRALSAHVVLEGEPSLAEAQSTTDEVKRVIASKFGIAHATLEPEARHCDPDTVDPCGSDVSSSDLRGVLAADRRDGGESRERQQHDGHAAV
jgi:cobalt-zinc-cadmium efflux system protein